MGILVLVVFLAQPADAPPPSTMDAPAKTVLAETPEPVGPPTPYFASYRSLRLALPVPPEAVTLLAFHQASGDKALHMEPLAPLTDMVALAERVQERDFTTSAALAEENGSCDDGYANALWKGEALQLWRSNRTGPPDTAVDVGARPGTEVRAPVSGTILAVRRYLLYDRHEDYEIHIQPDGWPEVDVVLIHVSDVLVDEGDTVIGGVTPIASVRSLSDKVDLHLGSYTGNGGDHVHVQLNELPDPAMIELIGES